MSLICFLSCSGVKDQAASNDSPYYSIDSINTVRSYSFSKSSRRYYCQFQDSAFIKDLFVNDTTLVLTNYLGINYDTIYLSEPITSQTHHFFGDLNSNYIFSSSFNYQDDEPDCIYRIHRSSGTVEKVYPEIDFMDYGERFGRSLINQFERNDTFFLGFQYPYLNSSGNSGKGIWDVPHLGMAYRDRDSLKFIRAFGYQKPELAEEYIWKHPKVDYVPTKNEILFAYYWSSELLVYDFKGSFKRSIKIDIEDFDQTKFYGNSFQPGCFSSGEWDAYMRDSVLHFSQVGYLENLGLYYRTIAFAYGDARGKSGIVLFNEHGEIQKMLSGFEDEFALINLMEDHIYTFNKAYDSLNYRVIKYLKYEYPEGW
jgi:hypothetical protein